MSGKGWGYAVTQTLRPETVAAQGGKKKPRRFWKKPETMAVLRKFASGEITLEQASATLGVSATYKGALPPVQWYAERYGMWKKPNKMF